MTRPAVGVESRDEGRWLRVTIDRPKANVLTEEVIGELCEVLRPVPHTGPCRLVSVEGAGSHFSFGASVEEHLPSTIHRVLPAFHALIRALVEVPVVTVAIVRGQCLGGGFEVALACDAIFAAEDARLGLPEITLGVFPPAAAALLPARVGSARAMQAVLSGEAWPARDWHGLGLIQQVAAEDGLETAVNAWYSAQLASKSAAALRHAVFATRSETRRLVLEVLPEIERYYLEELMGTSDAVEGIQAFLEKRPPRWSDS